MLKLSPIWSELQAIWYWFNLKERLYDLREGHTCLGFPPHGCTTYFSGNCGPLDSERVQKWLKKQNLEGYNTRCFKSEISNGQVLLEFYALTLCQSKKNFPSCNSCITVLFIDRI